MRDEEWDGWRDMAVEKYGVNIEEVGWHGFPAALRDDITATWPSVFDLAHWDSEDRRRRRRPSLVQGCSPSLWPATLSEASLSTESAADSPRRVVLNATEPAGRWWKQIGHQTDAR